MSPNYADRMANSVDPDQQSNLGLHCLLYTTYVFAQACLSKNFESLRVSELPHDKTNRKSVRTAKPQISLGICPVWSESLLCAQWVAKDPSFLHADS